MPTPNFIGGSVVAQAVYAWDGATFSTLKSWGVQSTSYTAPGLAKVILSPNLAAPGPESRTLSIDVQTPTATAVVVGAQHNQGATALEDEIQFFDAAGAPADLPVGTRVAITWTRSELPEG